MTGVRGELSPGDWLIGVSDFAKKFIPTSAVAGVLLRNNSAAHVPYLLCLVIAVSDGDTLKALVVALLNPNELR